MSPPRHSSIVCIPVSQEGFVDPRWGRTDRVAVAKVTANTIQSWQEFDVGWGQLHDSGNEAGHHARVARFLKEHEVGVVVANHMGPPMEHMLGKMGIEVHLGAAGRASEALLGLLNDRRS
jgi:predicted Fe-Mo cluster-binding NifX family protein